MSSPPDRAPQGSSTPVFWREATFWIVVLAWCGLFAVRLTTLPLRGEETRWARAAYEMLETDDWFVSRQQGVPFPNRPPFHEWMIASASAAMGTMSTAAVRLPAILGVLLAAVMIYRFARRFLSAYGAAAAAIVFLSSLQVLQLGRMAESEGVFVGAVTTALFGWHLGYRSGRPAWQTWCTTYIAIAAAALTKGPQGAVYVGSAIGLYLLLRRDSKFLFTPGHALGLSVFALLFGGWYVGCGLKGGFATANGTVFAMVNMRLANRGSLPMHMLRYPWEVLAALMPWSPFLARYAWPDFRNDLGPARDGVLFCAAALAATFPSVWLIYGALSRHYFSMYPCFAVLVGVVLERTFLADAGSSLGLGWKWFRRSILMVAAVGAAVIAAAPFIQTEWSRRLTQPGWFVACFIALVAAAVWILRRPTPTDSPSPSRAFVGFAGFAAVVVLIGTAYVGVSLNVLAGMANDNAAQTLAAKELLPPGTKLASFGMPEHVFLFHYQDPVRRLPWPKPHAGAPKDVEYFAISPMHYPPFKPGFEWEQVAVISCDRNVKPTPERVVVIGRIRRDHVAASAQSSQQSRR